MTDKDKREMANPLHWERPTYAAHIIMSRFKMQDGSEGTFQIAVCISESIARSIVVDCQTSFVNLKP